MKATLGTAKATIARVLGMHEDDSRVADYINEAQQRLLNRGDWKDTVIRYRVCVNNAKLTWPRQIESILKCNVCETPAVIASKWYEFSGSGPGTMLDDDNPGLVLEDMGTAPTFDDIVGTDKAIKVLASHVEAAGSRILIQGWDNNNLWVRTLDSVSGEYVDGEYVTLSTTAQYATSTFTNITGVIKPSTIGRVYLYEYEASTGSQKPLAIYENDETHPTYRRSRIPGLADIGTCACETNCVTGQTTVNVLAKLKYIPVVNDNDWLIIGNIPALKDMVMSIDKAEKHLVGEAEYYERRALRELSDELKNHEGAGIPQYEIQEPATFGAGGVEGVI